MSGWFNINEGLSSIKGQLTTFANNVLAEDEGADPTSAEYKQLCVQKDLEIQQLQNAIKELQLIARKNDEPNDNTWDWSPADPPPTNLQDKVHQLEIEKNELQNQLEQLDSEHQQNLTELMAIKDKLQEENENLKEENSRLKHANLEKTLESPSGEVEGNLTELMAIKDKLQEENSRLKQENQDKTLESPKGAVQENLETLEKRNKELQQELDKTREIIRAAEVKSKEDAENCQKLAFILETYEKQVNSLKEELKQLPKLQNEVDSLTIKMQQQAELIHNKYVTIISQNAKRYIDAEESPPEEVDADNSQLVQFSHQVENIFKILLEFKEKSYSLEQDLMAASNEKTRILNEKYEEIEKLIQNSELLSQEMLKKDETIKELESELRHLITNNDELLAELSTFKNSGLQTISESNEDSMVLLESDLENATKRIKELEQIIDSPSKTSYQDLLNSFDQLKLDYDETASNLKEATSKLQRLEVDNDELKVSLEKARSELENLDYQLSESNFSLDSLKDELERLETENKNFKLSNMNMIDLKTELNDVKEKWMNEENLRRHLEANVKILTEKQQNSKVSETSLKVQLDTLNKEHSSVVEARNSLEAALDNTKTNLEEYKNNYTELLQKYDEVLVRCEDLNTELHSKEGELAKLRELGSEELQNQLQELATSRNELINMVQIKHQESLNYHQEIQRLTAVLTEETQKKLQLEAKLVQTCEDLALKNEQIDKLKDENDFLKEECQVLRAKVGPSEKEQSLSKQLERLQSHLMEMQERHTQEMLQAEQRNQELQAKAADLEQREKSSSTMYTSVSIRANQQVEALQNQLQTANSQKEEARKRVSELEDLNNKQAAALANLQFVLEQFQKDKEKDVQQETERIRRQIAVEKRTQEELRKELGNLKGQLEESKVGLQAASRLADQLEILKRINSGLKDEVSQLQQKLDKSQRAIDELSSQTDGKIDKSLIRNLIVGFLSSGTANWNKDQAQVLKLIATVLDFNQQDHDKVRLHGRAPQGSWLTSLMGPAQSGAQDSLAQAFVRFLENESKPRDVPSLLGESAPSSQSSKRTTPSPIVLNEVVLPTFADFGQSRSSSSILKDVLKDNNR